MSFGSMFGPFPLQFYQCCDRCCLWVKTLLTQSAVEDEERTLLPRFPNSSNFKVHCMPFELSEATCQSNVRTNSLLATTTPPVTDDLETRAAYFLCASITWKLALRSKAGSVRSQSLNPGKHCAVLLASSRSLLSRRQSLSSWFAS